MNTSGRPFDVAVRGVGIAGCAMALALSRQGLRVALQGDAPRHEAKRDDVRAYALNAASVRLLDQLGVWTALAVDARTPIHDMRIEGDTHASALTFSAWQQRVDQLGWIVDAAALEVAMMAQVRAMAGPCLTHVPESPGDVDATLLIVAEGKGSSTREALGVTFTRQPYEQHAVAARLVAERPHQHMARQWFLAPDILALLPFDRPKIGHAYGLVWSVAPERARALLALSVAEFEDALNAAAQTTHSGGPGRLTLASERAAWPLALAHADRVVGQRASGGAWVLIGDAAHQVHPLAGQGLNLGLGDVQALADVIAARESWRPLDDPRLLDRHARRRALPVASMSFTTDALQRLFSHPSPVARELRNRGLGLVDLAVPVKRWLASEALGH